MNRSFKKKKKAHCVFHLVPGLCKELFSSLWIQEHRIQTENPAWEHFLFSTRHLASSSGGTETLKAAAKMDLKFKPAFFAFPSAESSLLPFCPVLKYFCTVYLVFLSLLLSRYPFGIHDYYGKNIFMINDQIQIGLITDKLNMKSRKLR